ncbi:TetR/AcrR family transcriptional regulator [Rhodococcus triatomae]|uniref:DNA-binding transcriptional regulator, AcrR family n=1 Tax=Rhodococcus triatomae TaxID=300028 RepID=A0A1G8ICI5_9NOCA|nr:TetR/AcrR family transcriptional regulator [Rhodococcus triatomae]QNG21019.1 TetR/AcrR family transcriptional regulator [Rhodococcus triatomae]QNG23066.1 TetR/AcrR family transcriptional regulator [Rhodococcus triatomae]SDI16689.1 DNA-binding transcriptional regulator, AcrR family [Rhodococcus triatomae]
MTASARDRLIAGAIELLRTKGVAGTSVADLVAASGTARRSIYLNFPDGREELLEASSRAAGAVMSAQLRSALDVDDSAEALTEFVRVWADALEGSDYRAGCPIVAVALGGDQVPAGPSIAAEVFADWTGAIADRLVRGGVDEDTAASLATMIVASIEGATVMSIAQRSTEPLDRVTWHLRELVALHG